jgi:CRISPR-associated endoribonuclease Cas6
VGDERTLVVSSPDSSIVKALNNSIPEIIHLGESEFRVVLRSLMNLKLRDGGILITSTPVVVRIPRVRYCDYGIESSHEYVYWRMQYPVNAFLKQLEENLQRKYTEFHGEDITVPLVFEEMQSIKNPAVYTIIDNNRV